MSITALRNSPTVKSHNEMGTSEGQSSQSLQMTLLHLRWQHIRQMELQQVLFQPKPQEEVAVHPTQSNNDHVYSVA
ncbi:MAG: hypothetical protein ACHQJ6_00425 [Candidatus Berkiellales bacterium]